MWRYHEKIPGGIGITKDSGCDFCYPEKVMPLTKRLNMIKCN